MQPKDKTMSAKESIKFQPAPIGMSAQMREQWHAIRHSCGCGPGGDNRGNSHGHAEMAAASEARRNDGTTEEMRRQATERINAQNRGEIGMECAGPPKKFGE